MGIITTLDLSKILFDEIFPESMVRKYEKEKNIDLKNEFVKFLNKRGMEPKFDRDISRIMLLSILDDHHMQTIYGEDVPFERIFYVFDDIILLQHKK